VQIRALLPDRRKLQCDNVVYESDHVFIHVSSFSSCAACPSCGCYSERIHSRYIRHLADLPWQGRRVTVRWHSRRFFCVNPHCRQRIFAERLPEVATAHARKTTRLTAVLRAVAFACGGEEGARLADRLAINTSPDTLLREIRHSGSQSSCRPDRRRRRLGFTAWATLRHHPRGFRATLSRRTAFGAVGRGLRSVATEPPRGGSGEP
jgi:transposase